MEEFLFKYLSIKDIVTIGIVYFATSVRVGKFLASAKEEFSEVKKTAQVHLSNIEMGLKDIKNTISGLNDSLVSLEKSQTKNLNDLSLRVVVIENKLEIKN